LGFDDLLYFARLFFALMFPFTRPPPGCPAIFFPPVCLLISFSLPSYFFLLFFYFCAWKLLAPCWRLFVPIYVCRQLLSGHIRLCRLPLPPGVHPAFFVLGVPLYFCFFLRPFCPFSEARQIRCLGKSFFVFFFPTSPRSALCCRHCFVWPAAVCRRRDRGIF